MALGPRLDLRQSQQLVMTPQLQQAIKLLALSNVELETYIGEELEKNPLLDTSREEADDEGMDGTALREASSEAATTDELIATGHAESDAPLDVDYGAETYHHDSPADGVGLNGGVLDGGLGLNTVTAGGAVPEDGEGFEATLSEEPSLHDVLTAQLAGMDQAERLVASHIIDLIDEAGYFTGSCDEVGQRLGLSAEAVEAVLVKIQSFEPTGVGARTLAECLAIQAREADRYDPAMRALIGRLDLLARGDLTALRRHCRVDAEDLADMIRELRAYNPKPGLQYGSGGAQPIMPDVFVARKPSGGWLVEVNSATLPRLLVNRSYAGELGAHGADKGTRSFLADCMTSANWLVKALDQRQRTIVKVATEIVRQQEGFFVHGVAHLRPLNLRVVAEAIDMHESTVSRVTSNKYLSCERGLFELKYFFTSAIQSADGGDAASAEAVKTRLQALIGAESPKKVLSDDKLVELLRGDGFDIARRTVAKYREALGIGSSVQRRRSYAIHGTGTAA